MSIIRNTLSLASALAGLFHLSTSAHAQVPTYTVTVLAAPAGAYGGEAYGINDNGVIVGTGAFCILSTPGCQDGRQWTLPSSAAMLVPGLAGATNWKVTEINDSGTMVGATYFPGSSITTQPTVWINGQPSLLPPAAPGKYTNAYDINAFGEIAGDAQDINNQRYAARWTGGALTLLTRPASGTACLGAAINDASEIAGHCSISNVQTAVAWTGTTPTVLPHAGLGISGQAYGLNDDDMVVGRISVSNKKQLAARWLAGVPSILKKNSTVVNSWARAVNDDDLIVGTASLSNGNHYGTVWFNLNTMVHLPSPAGLNRCEAWDIDSSGRIVGMCWNTSVSQTLVPVVWLPQP